jgi:regulation of enolase protein 1 (concanavalin A-like superfamily)
MIEVEDELVVDEVIAQQIIAIFDGAGIVVNDHEISADVEINRGSSAAIISSHSTSSSSSAVIAGI